MTGWKIPSWSDGIGAVVGSIPRIIKHFKDKARVNEVTKIEDAVSSGDDSAINSELRKIVTKEDKRNKANS